MASEENLSVVAGPALLLAGKKTRFISRKKRYNGITITVVREDSFKRDMIESRDG